VNGASLLGELILLVIAVGCIACLWRAVHRPAPVPDEPLEDPDVIAHEMHEESQL
jgi:hypothetical protein